MKHTKQLLIGSIALIVLAVAIVVGVFFYVQALLQPVPNAPVSPVNTPTAAPKVVTQPVVDTTDAIRSTDDEETIDTATPSPEATTVEASPAVTPPLPPAGIPLRDLPLSEAQLSTLSTFGIDVETFVLSPAMIACAEQNLGSDRLAAIKAGTAPSFTEALSLVGCITE